MSPNLQLEQGTGNVPAGHEPVAWREYMAAMSRADRVRSRITTLSDALDQARAELTYDLEDAADALRRLAVVRDAA